MNMYDFFVKIIEHLFEYVNPQSFLYMFTSKPPYTISISSLFGL